MATENRLVYASDVRREILSAEPRLAYIVERIKPVDAVGVVRCRDCKHWKEADDGRSWQMIGRTDGACRWLAEQHYAERYMTEGEHFCSYGERRCDNEAD